MHIILPANDFEFPINSYQDSDASPLIQASGAVSDLKVTALSTNQLAEPHLFWMEQQEGVEAREIPVLNPLKNSLKGVDGYDITSSDSQGGPD